jgi:hypothetical protein
MEVIRKTIENKGIFYCLYVNKASHFKTTRYKGLHVNIDSEQKDTQDRKSFRRIRYQYNRCKFSSGKG